MTNYYSFSLEYEDDPSGGVLANFPDVPEALAHGRDRAEATAQARIALAVALFGYLKEGWAIPKGECVTGYCVAPHAADVLKIAVVEAWLTSGMSKSDFARLLGVDEKEARRILDPDAATKVDRLERSLAVLGRRLHIAVEAA